MANIGNQLVIMKAGRKLDFSQAAFDLKCDERWKPNEAFWTSSVYFGKDDRKYHSAWTDWCEINDYLCNYDSDVAYILIPKKKTKVLTINDGEDYDRLIRDYITVKKTFDPRYNEYLDFKKMQDNGYDGFHLTSNAAWQFHFHQFNSWDCESTAWFNVDWIKEVIKLTSEDW